MRYRVLLVVALLVLSGCQFLASDPTDGEASDSTPNGVTSEAIQTTEGLPVQTEVSYQTWTLDVVGVNVSAREGGEFAAYVFASGQFQGTAHGVKLQFLDTDRQVVEQHDLGNMTSPSTKKWVNTTVPTVPVYVIAKIDRWETSDTELVASAGFQITADGEIRPYELTDPENFTY
jgi:hypothetical protein